MQFFAGNVKKYNDLLCSQNYMIRTESMILSGNENWRSIPIDKHSVLFWYGECFYYSDSGKDIMKFKGDQTLKDAFFRNTLENAINKLEGRFIGIIYNKKEHSSVLFTDRLGRVELFYTTRGKDVLVSTDLEGIKPFMESIEFDPMGIANVIMLTYTPKPYTIYKDIFRLNVGEHLYVDRKGFEFKKSQPYLRPIVPYGDDDLERYWELIQDAFYSRASDTLNWVETSSGWDSTFCLSLLRREYDADKVRAVTINCDYSTRHDSINHVEVERAKKIANHFGVKHDTIQTQISSNDVIPIWERLRSYWAKLHIFGYGPYIHDCVARHISRNGMDGQVVFNGEACDGLHNFGFSQYITTMHNSFNFREYADKMANYLYGPSFFKSVEDGSFLDDAVYKIVRNWHATACFDDISKSDRKHLLQVYLMPFIWGSVRIPFYSFENSSQFMTGNGNEAFKKWSMDNYLDSLIDQLTAQNIYSVFVWLYLLFHLQGSAIRGVGAAMDKQGLHWRQPFMDSRLVDLFAEMPESWGRGLNFTHTKYPLKWVISNKIDYPMDLLWGGRYGIDERTGKAHSYVMEVDQRVTVPLELLCHSGLTNYFKDLLKPERYRLVLDSNIFNLEYYDNIISDYKNKNLVKTEDGNILLHLCYLLDRLII